MDEYCAVDKFDIRNYSINNDQNELSPRMGNYDRKYYFSRDKCEPRKHVNNIVKQQYDQE